MIKRIIIGILLNSFTLYLLALFLKSHLIIEGGLKTFLFAGLIIGVFHVIIKPIARLLTFPLILLTGGLFMYVINAALLWGTAYIVNTYGLAGMVMTIPGILSYFIIAIFFSVIAWIIHRFV